MRANPPSNEEIEISLFGPGYGESIVAHLGYGNWIVIDSCLDEDGRSIALSYFDQIGVLPSDSLKLVVSTHWHDDHIRGLSEILKVSNNAKFYCTSAIGEKVFEELLAGSFQGALQPMGSGLDEIRETLKLFNQTKKRVYMATDEKRVWFDPQNKMEIWSHSPTSTAMLASMARVSSIKDNLNTRRIPYVSPNLSSVVLSIHVEDHSILLGGDLEVSENKDLGWHPVLSSYENAGKRKPSVFKIPHHGSENGYHSSIWEDLLVKQPIGLVTPYNRGQKPLPTIEDLQRIKGCCSEAYLTSPAAATRYKSRDKAIDKAFRECAKKVSKIRRELGHVRIRLNTKDPDARWRAECFGNAAPLNSNKG